jgi:hypothetical protein
VRGCCLALSALNAQQRCLLGLGLVVALWLYLKIMWIVDTPYELMYPDQVPARPVCDFLIDSAKDSRKAGFAGDGSFQVDAAGNFKPKIGVITFYNNMEPGLMRASVQNKYQFVFEHKYELIIADDLIDHSRPSAWSKFPIMRRYLPNFDFLVWLDADALVSNFAMKIEDFVDNEHDLWFGEDENDINSGVFIVRRSSWSMWWLEECWNQEWLVTGNHPFKYEQRAIHYLFGTKDMLQHALTYGHKKHPATDEVRKRTQVLPACVGFNSNICEEFWTGLILWRRTPWKGMWCENVFKAGDFVLHLAGKAPAFYRNWLVIEFHKLINEQYFDKIVRPRLIGQGKLAS